jgi:hypothetical protein
MGKGWTTVEVKSLLGFADEAVPLKVWIINLDLELGWPGLCA